MPYGGDPANSQTDAVRSLLSDTSTSAPSLSDNEVQWLVDQHPNVYYAAAAGADMLAGKNVDTATAIKVGDLSVETGTASEGIAGEYRGLAKQLRQIAAHRGVPPAAGGISVADKTSVEADADWDRSEIRLGMHDNSGTPGGW